MAYWYDPMKRREWRARGVAAHVARDPGDQRRPVRLVIVRGIGDPSLSWRPLSTLHGCAVDEGGSGAELLVRIRTWDAAIEHPIRSMTDAEIERDVRALVARTLAGVRVIEVEHRA